MEEVIEVGEIQINPNNTVHATVKTSAMKDGKQIGSTIDVLCIKPGDDYSDAPEKVQTICAALHIEPEAAEPIVDDVEDTDVLTDE